MIPFGGYIGKYFSLEALYNNSVVTFDQNKQPVIDSNKLEDYQRFNQFTTIYGVSDQDLNKSYP